MAEWSEGMRPQPATNASKTRIVSFAPFDVRLLLVALSLYEMTGPSPDVGDPLGAEAPSPLPRFGKTG